MAQCKQSSQEFIKNVFNPQIAIMCTPLADKCCQKNNLNFIELLQPFSKLNSDLHYKDPTGANITIHNLKLTFLDVNSRPPQTTLARKYLNSSVSDAPEPRNQIHYIGEYKLEVPSSTPWFEAWRDTFLKVQYPSDHEYTKHFLACVLVVASTDNNPVETMVQLAQSLNQMQATAPGKLPKWFSSNILKYYVILHDNVEGINNIANESFESLKVSYGAPNCFLLRMNSRPPGLTNSDHLPDPWSQFIMNQIESKDCKPSPESSPNTKRNALEVGEEANEVKNTVDYHPLSPDTEELFMNETVTDGEPAQTKNVAKTHGSCLATEDVEQVKLFVYEFSKCCLLPYIEKQIVLLNDVVSNKKGMSKSLFNATKRWFSPNKPGASSVAVNNLIYAPDSPELQIRRLGDLYFMFGHYSNAFQAYHLAKRDYNTDQAWLYYAGALEMAALSAYMSNESTKKTYDYMEDAITTYLNTCKMPQFATRATLLSSECLKNKTMYGDAAHQLIRMTSEESDLRSALLLEQAAYCFLQSKMLRKYAFHMVLAGHRFSKAAQRKHSLRCYEQAYQIYENTGWDLASDHIHYTIGRQANNLQHFNEAVQSFAKLLKGGSKQSAQQQAVFLKEYLTILGNKLKNESETNIPLLPVPELDINSIKVLVGPTRPLSTPGKVPALGINFSNDEDLTTQNKWNKLEEMLVHEAEGSLPLMFKPMVTLYKTNMLDKNCPLAIVNEPLQISIQLVNSLQAVLHLRDMFIIWNFKNQNETISNENSDLNVDKYVKTHVNKSTIIQGNSKQELVLALTPLVTGEITIIGICYTLTGSNTPTENIFIKGKQLLNFKNVKTKSNSQGNNVKNKKELLEINVVPSAPCLQVTFPEMNLEFLSDELQRISIDFQNTGSVPLQNIFMATSVPHLLCNCEFKKETNTNINVNEADTPALKEKLARKNHITSVPLPGDRLEPGQSTTIYIWIKAPSKKGPAVIDLLIYYENVNSKSIPRYRLVRHSWNLNIQESVAIELSTQGSYNAKTVEELALAIKTTNLNKIHNSISTEITLLNVALLSKYWRLTKDTVTPKYINLNSQESAHILLKARRSVHQESQYSNIPLNMDKNESIQNINSAYLAFAKKTEQRTINIFEDSELTNLSNENKDGVLLLQWQALVSDANNKRTVHGQTQIPIEINRKEEDPTFQLERILYDSVVDICDTKEEDNSERALKQITYSLVYPAVIQHNFQKHRLCIVPVNLLIHSIVDNGEVSVSINTQDTSSKVSHNQSNLFYPYASNQFRWLGNGNIIRILSPLSTDSVQLSVVLSGPGTFDLGAHIEVLCTKVGHNDPPVLQSCQVHSALIVTNIEN